MKRLSRWVLAAGGGLLLAGALWAQLPKPEDVVEVRLEPSRLETHSGATAAFTLVAIIREGFHINSHKPLQDYLIPTRVELPEASPFVLDKVDYPAGELKSFGFAPDEKLSVYEGTLKLPLRLRAKPGAPAGSQTVPLAFHFQACNDQLCLRPARREAALKVLLK